MIPVAGVLGVLLMATTVWASASYVGGLFGGPQPETVLPGSAVAFAKLDMKPSGGQLANYAQFANKLPDSVKDEIDPEADPAEEMVDEFLKSEDIEGLDYQQDFEPWLGQRFGAAVWKPDNEDAAANDGSAVAIAIAVEDQAAAEKTLTELQGQLDDFHFEVRDDFALVTPKEAALRDLDKQVEQHGTLDSAEPFASDMAEVGDDSLAAAWGDLEGLSAFAEDSGDSYSDYEDYGSDPFSSFGNPEDVKGRIAVGLKVEADYLELRGDMLEVSANGTSLEDYKISEPGIDALGRLPDDTVLAVGGSGIDEAVKQAYEQNPEQFGDLQDGLEQIGAPLPEGASDLLGTKTALGITDFGGSMDDLFQGYGEMPSFQFRGTGADSGVLQDLTDALSEGSYGTPPGVNTEGQDVVISSGSTGTGKLADQKMYKRVMQGMDQAHMGLYLDLRPFMEEAGEGPPEQWGSVGGSLTYSGANASMLMRWAPNGGA